MEKYQNGFNNFITKMAPRFVVGLSVLVLGLWTIAVIVKVLKKQFLKKNFHKTTSLFFTSIVGIILRVFLFMLVLMYIGVPTTSLIAVLGAAGVAIGLSLQNSLSNLAGGFIIVFFNYFKVGDWIESKDGSGHVTEIKLFATRLVDLDNKSYIIPNSRLSNESVTNFSSLGKIRLEIPIGIAYDSDIKKAREALVQSMIKHPMVLASPLPSVKVTGFGDNAILIVMRPWLKTNDPWWDINFDLIEGAKLALDNVSVKIPFPQRVIHIKKD